MLDDIGAGARGLAVEQLADGGQRRSDGLGIALRLLRVVDDGADHAHDQFAFCIVQVGAGVLQGLPGQVTDEGGFVAHVGISRRAR